MASRWFPPLGILGLNRVAVSGRFFPNGAQAAGTPVFAIGKGFSIIYGAAAGGYVIILDDKYVELTHFGATVQTTTGTSWTGSFGTYTNPSNSVSASIEIFTRQGGILLDLPSNANNSVAFWLTFRNSSVNF